MDRNIGYLANDIGRLFRKRLDVFSRPAGITGAQVRVLLNIRRHPGINQSTLASLLEVEPITAGRMIDRMVAADLVERRADPTDRRSPLAPRCTRTGRRWPTVSPAWPADSGLGSGSAPATASRS